MAQCTADSYSILRSMTQTRDERVGIDNDRQAGIVPPMSNRAERATQTAIPKAKGMSAAALELLEFCPACEGRSFRPFAESDGLQIVRCNSCSLIFSNPRVSEAHTRQFYAQVYLEDQAVIASNMTAFRDAPLRRIAQTVRAYLPTGGTLLDVGTASGHFLSLFLDDPAWRVEGVEPSLSAARSASDRFCVTVHKGFLDTVSLPSEAFDVVSILDTFFLDPEPNRTIAVVNRILKPGGLLVFEIPGLNFRLLKNTGIIARLLYGQNAQLNPSMQMFFYEEKTLSTLVGRHGYALIGRDAEQSPIYGSFAKRLANHAYFRASRALYRATSAGFHYAPKEILIYWRGAK